MSQTLLLSVISFWFEEIDKSQWWVKDPSFDKLIEGKFGQIHASAIKCELQSWRATPIGRLAEIIVLDQFSRNIYRDNRRSFAYDSLALTLAQESVSLGCLKELTEIQNNFLLMPYMHSESKKIHQCAVDLYAEHGSSETLEFELKHKAIIDKFGRYPHRNVILGRNSSAEELEFLKTQNSSF